MNVLAYCGNSTCRDSIQNALTEGRRQGMEAITFDELVKHGLDNATNSMNGVPWAFTYKGHHVTHENDDCYLIPAFDGTGSKRFNRGDLLVTSENGEIHAYHSDTYKFIWQHPHPTGCDQHGRFSSTEPWCPICLHRALAEAKLEIKHLRAELPGQPFPEIASS